MGGSTDKNRREPAPPVEERNVVKAIPEIHVVSVFGAGPAGGNPAPIILDADALPDSEMQAITRQYGHEAGFVLQAQEGSGCDLALRFWVPNHEVAMCGHATVGAVWLLDALGRLPTSSLSISTASGIVRATVTHEGSADRIVRVSQPVGEVQEIANPEFLAEVGSVLGLQATDLASFPVQNARTSRVKTLIPMADEGVLDRLAPDFARMEALCDRVNSTGMYPYAVVNPTLQVFAARQFPRSSGYPEDAATGIAAAALAFGLLANGLVEASDRDIVIRQGWAMGRPSEIRVNFEMKDGAVSACWIGGKVTLSDLAPDHAHDR
ncbi:PhzF family phenazine biosynthesis protein [Sphingomonas abietis]|uniref:PhzF family phenazine biosynthesis isomerase n=1 Tax=Sphingomonas abietis TaxID=3012344 RepID=A0ABY7NK07_9SPHN|nr:PhzF family phenazine biosynthesis isomerase [Sphingomonas abietis]WBO21814.1 PhzF family phenazine biosynthesis isomerase [Sphingomonas abietis]